MRSGARAKVGVLTVKLFRPFSVRDFVAALPATVRAIAVLDRTKEPGAIGEPLYQDVVTAIAEALADGTAPFTRVPARHRRALWARVEGVHAGDGQSRVRRARPPARRSAISPSASSTT